MKRQPLPAEIRLIDFAGKKMKFTDPKSGQGASLGTLYGYPAPSSGHRCPSRYDPVTSRLNPLLSRGYGLLWRCTTSDGFRPSQSRRESYHPIGLSSPSVF
ncbi:MAG: hypothetical protein OXC61_09930 [Flavobacteriaceae bacterium]|nr:hypothetical protein [Flavobacteriaceae bacterium]